MNLLTTTLAALLASASFAAACETTLRSSDTHPDGYPTVEAVKAMAAEVKEKTGDRICIEVFPSSQLGEEKDAIEQTQFGVIDMIRASFGSFNNIVPLTQTASLPYLYKSNDQMYKVMDGPLGEQIAAQFAEHDLVPIAWYDGGSRNFYNSKKPIRTVADLQGMKFRVMQNDVFVDMMGALGASATPMPYGEVYSAIQTGVIDGAENNAPSYDSAGHADVAKYYTEDAHLIVPEAVLVSKSVWDNMTPEDQAILKEAGKNSAILQRKLWADQVNASMEKVKASGAEVITDVDKTAFQEAMAPVYEKYVTTPEQKAFVEGVQATN